MKKYRYAIFIVILLAVIGICLVLPKPTGNELEILKQMLPQYDKITELENIKTDSFINENFPAIKNAYQSNGKIVGFLAKPIGYIGEISIMIALDGDKGIVSGINIISHNDTPDYADHIQEGWFTERFRDKNLSEYLNLVTLDANEPNDIIQVTGATITSQAVVNGVNSAIGAWQYLENKKNMEPVPAIVQQEMWQKDDNSFVITWADGEKRIGMDELKAYKQHQQDVELQKTTGTLIDMKVEGPLLKEVLEEAGLNIADYAGIGVSGRDGYYTLIDKDKLRNPIILAWKSNGKEIGKDEKPIRVVLPSEMGPYWVKMVCNIDLYDEIAPKEISRVFAFNALTRDIEPYYYEYYGSKDKSIEVGKIFKKFDDINPKGFFTMTSIDGLEKNETISLVRERYFIKVEGDNAPMNIAPSFKLGMNVKEMCVFSTTSDAVIFPDKIKEISRSEQINGEEMLILEDVLINAKLDVTKAKGYIVKDFNGDSFQFTYDDLANLYLSANKGNTRLYKDNSLITDDFLSIEMIKE